MTCLGSFIYCRLNIVQLIQNKFHMNFSRYYAIEKRSELKQYSDRIDTTFKLMKTVESGIENTLQLYLQVDKQLILQYFISIY